MDSQHIKLLIAISAICYLDSILGCYAKKTAEILKKLLLPLLRGNGQKIMGLLKLVLITQEQIF